MLYFIHHPAGNVVIRTNNPYIVLQHQVKGWMTTTSWEDVLQDHPEWRSPETAHPSDNTYQAKSLAARLCTALLSSLSPTLAAVPGHTPSGVQTTASLLATHNPGHNENACEESSNTSPVHWRTAIERKWYHERGLGTPEGAWIVCAEDDEAFDYLLMNGVWDLDMVQTYDD
ncbi:hypothetical protein BKA63DRAFT_494239 [Paraphoma chrysanthemicola]|nr:hypothetical protein BKA63DRAFT_494239 [Paraphoma chrysanthemicola]